MTDDTMRAYIRQRRRLDKADATAELLATYIIRFSLLYVAAHLIAWGVS